MRKALITIQENQLTEEQLQQLDKMIRNIYSALVGSEKLLIIWCYMPAGQLYTNNQTSSSAVVTLECVNGFSQPQREFVLKRLANNWQEITQTNCHELMIALVDEDALNSYFKMTQQQFSIRGLSQKRLVIFKTWLMSKLFQKPFIISPNS